MKIITEANFASEVLGSKKPVLLDVWAPWCAPCRGMMPVVEALADEVKDWADVAKLDASTEENLTQLLDVSCLPTFLVFKDGKVVGSTMGVVAKNTLLDLLKKAQ